MHAAIEEFLRRCVVEAGAFGLADFVLGLDPVLAPRRQVRRKEVRLHQVRLPLAQEADQAPRLGFVVFHERQLRRDHQFVHILSVGQLQALAHQEVGLVHRGLRRRLLRAEGERRGEGDEVGGGALLRERLPQQPEAGLALAGLRQGGAEAPHRGHEFRRLVDDRAQQADGRGVIAGVHCDARLAKRRQQRGVQRGELGLDPGLGGHVAGAQRGGGGANGKEQSGQHQNESVSHGDFAAGPAARFLDAKF